VLKGASVHAASYDLQRYFRLQNSQLSVWKKLQCFKNDNSWESSVGHCAGFLFLLTLSDLGFGFNSGQVHVT
jgi:hypothetical protein